jgi:hypothetical protein
LTFSAADFPVSPTVSPALAAVPATSATSGPSSSDSFASLNPDGSWRKTCQGYSQVTLDGSLEEYSETWPQAGMTQSGRAYLLPPLERCTDETESGSWPTPTARDWRSEECSPEFDAERMAHTRGKSLPTIVRQLPTPTANRWDGLQSHGVNGVSGSLNPAWVEVLMGYPKGWTEL